MNPLVGAQGSQQKADGHDGHLSARVPVSGSTQSSEGCFVFRNAASISIRSGSATAMTSGA